VRILPAVDCEYYLFIKKSAPVDRGHGNFKVYCFRPACSQKPSSKGTLPFLYRPTWHHWTSNTLPSKFRLDGWLDGSIYMSNSISWLSSGYLTWCPWSGQITGISSTEFGLANMILAAASVGKVRSRWVEVKRGGGVNASLLCRRVVTSRLLQYVIIYQTKLLKFITNRERSLVSSRDCSWSTDC